MRCEYCTHNAECSNVDKVGLPMMNLLTEAFPAINLKTALAATTYTMASLCPHYRTEEKPVSITIVSGDFPEEG